MLFYPQVLGDLNSILYVSWNLSWCIFFCILWMFAKFYCELILWVLYCYPNSLESLTSTQSHSGRGGRLCVLCPANIGHSFCCGFCRFSWVFMSPGKLFTLTSRQGECSFPDAVSFDSLEKCDSLCILITDGRHKQRPTFFVWVYGHIFLFLYSHFTEGSNHNVLSSA